jgi:hypothetical protein
MRGKLGGSFLLVGWLTLLLVVSLPPGLAAKEKEVPVSPNDPTYRLYQLLDTSYGGKLDEFYVIADTFQDPKKPGQEDQHILKLEYDKAHAFGKLRIYVRTVAKLTPAQLKTYTPKQIFDFAEEDSQKFTKTDPGPLGKTGDLYFVAKGNRPLASVPITDQARKEYDDFVTQYLLPALAKK